MIVLLTAIVLSNCGGDSSPEGRISKKLENLQKEMLESQRQQNAAILDSFRAIHEEIRKLQQKVK